MVTVLIVLGIGATMLTVEVLAPGRKWPKVAFWWKRAIALNGVQGAMVFVAGVTWDRWLQGISLWNAEDYFGTNGGAVFGYLVITFIYYWWHRVRHEVPALWRWLHQVHHSPQRLEIVTSFYKHPIEITVNSLLSSAILYMLCGLSVESAVIAVLLTGLAELFYHWNVKTPHWLGYFVQRPESHCVHHQMGWHSQNYSDLPVWDILFGTFHNPKSFDETCGFEDNKEQQLSEMLLGSDVHADADDLA